MRCFSGASSSSVSQRSIKAAEVWDQRGKAPCSLLITGQIHVFIHRCGRSFKQIMSLKLLLLSRSLFIGWYAIQLSDTKRGRFGALSELAGNGRRRRGTLPTRYSLWNVMRYYYYSCIIASNRPPAIRLFGLNNRTTIVSTVDSAIKIVGSWLDQRWCQATLLYYEFL